MMEALFFLVFIFILGTFIYVMVKNISQWHKNNNSPRLTVDATIVTKRRSVNHSHHNHNGHMHMTTSTTYYATFQFESGDRIELKVPSTEYGLLAEGDIGKLSFQGTRYLGFDRNIQT